MSTLRMRDVMTPAPHTIGSNQKLSFAQKIMSENRLRHLPVVCGGKFVGVLSQRDLAFMARLPGVDAEIERVAGATISDVYTTGPDAPLHDVAQLMAEQKYACAVILDRGSVVGIFTVTDALKRLAASTA